MLLSKRSRILIGPVVERLIILSGNSITSKDVDSFVHSSARKNTGMEELFNRFSSFEEMSGYMRAEYEKFRGVLV